MRRGGGSGLSALVILFLAMDGALKLVPIAPVTEAMSALGFPVSDATARGLGALLLACTALYAWPPTAPLGAIGLTAYLGGAVAVHLRAGSPVATHLLFGVYLGTLAWIGLWLRDARIRELFPFRPLS